jgi:ADP-ribose pyrophosphatase
MAQVFLFGALTHAPLRAAVLGCEVAGVPTRVPGWRVVAATGALWADLLEAPQAEAQGLAVDLDARGLERLEHFLGGFGYRLLPLAGFSGLCPQRPALAAPDWDRDGWLTTLADTATATARDMMDLRGLVPAEAMARRFQAMLVRGAGRVRAAETAPTSLRHRALPGDVALAGWRQPYAAFFAMEESDLSWRRFDGAVNPPATRAGLISGDAVTVLPYDPVRDRVLLIEQFRAGPHHRGDPQPWQLEPIAGRIDPGETPETAARREAVEEAGLQLGRLVEVARYYPTPGICNEFLYSYLALTDLPDGSAGVFGLAEEAEDIRSHLVSFAALMALVASGEAGNAPLILTALWLQRERAALRAGSGDYG